FILRPFFLQCYATPPYLYSFPTRRSSDLIVIIAMENTPYSAVFGSGTPSTCPTSSAPFLCSMLPVSSTVPSMNNYGATSADGNRSEEHTSELQSRFDLVCRLLLEKKKHIHPHLDSRPFAHECRRPYHHADVDVVDLACLLRRLSTRVGRAHCFHPVARHDADSDSE